MQFKRGSQHNGVDYIQWEYYYTLRRNLMGIDVNSNKFVSYGFYL